MRQWCCWIVKQKFIDGSRIFTGGGPTLGEGDTGIKFNQMSWKLHEIKENLAAGGGGGRAPGMPLLDPPLRMVAEPI